MTRLEEVLREALREVPDPPRDIDVSDVRRRVVRRRRGVGALATIVLVLGLAAGLTVALTGGGGRPVPAADRSLSALENVLWRDPAIGSTLLVRNGTMQVDVDCQPMTYLADVTAAGLRRGRLLISGPACGGYEGPLQRAAYRRSVDRFAEVTSGPFSWGRDGSALTVTRVGVGSIRLVPSGRPDDLAGTSWRLESYRTGRALHGYRGSEQRLRLGGDSFDVSGSCPLLEGALTIGASVVDFRPYPIATNSCTVAGSGATTAEVSVLRGWVSYTVRDDELFLDAGKRGFLAFRAVGK